MVALCKKCDYEDANSSLINTLLRDQFIVGITNKSLQLKILEIDESKLTLEEAIKFAQDRNQTERIGIKGGYAEILATKIELHPEKGTKCVANINIPPKPKKSIKGQKKIIKLDTAKIYGCHFCSSAFKHERNLFRHYKQSHKDENIEGRIECKEVNCHQFFFSIRGWKRHRSLVHHYDSDDDDDDSEKADASSDKNVAGRIENDSMNKVNKALVLT